MPCRLPKECRHQHDDRADRSRTCGRHRAEPRCVTVAPGGAAPGRHLRRPGRRPLPDLRRVTRARCRAEALRWPGGTGAGAASRPGPRPGVVRRTSEGLGPQLARRAGPAGQVRLAAAAHSRRRRRRRRRGDRRRGLGAAVAVVGGRRVGSGGAVGDPRRPSPRHLCGAGPRPAGVRRTEAAQSELDRGGGAATGGPDHVPGFVLPGTTARGGVAARARRRRRGLDDGGVVRRGGRLRGGRHLLVGGEDRASA
jgi:hypothetical protein